MKRLLLALSCVLVCTLAVAQAAPVVTLTATPTTAIASSPVTLNWSTTPAALSCTASGDWTGTKTASGTATLPTITASKSYVLTCSFAATGAAHVQWVAPTTNTDGSPLTNLASYKVYFGTSATAMTQTATAAAPAASLDVTGLANGTWFFAATAISATGQESVKSNVAQKTIAPASATATASVTITPDTTPSPPASLTVVDPIAYDVRPSEALFAYVRGRPVGTAKLGAVCDDKRTTGSGFYALTEPNKVHLTQFPRSQALVAKCAQPVAAS